MKQIFLNIALTCVSILFCLIAFEGFLILKNSIMPNYDVEMWKYSKLLKTPHENPNIGHVHRINANEVFQKVEIRTDRSGLRLGTVTNGEDSKFDRSIMLLGSSIALGWGVSSDHVLSSQIEKLAIENGFNWKVHNAGVGNYNATRYVTNYLTNLSDIDTDTILVLFFVNDTEVLTNNYGNIFTRNLQSAVLVWKYMQSFNEQLGIESIEDYYRSKYKPSYKGFQKAKSALTELSKFCTSQNKRCVLAMMPDIHQLNPYPLGFVHKAIGEASNELGYEYLDLLSIFEGQEAKVFWNKFNDPHPNAHAYALISEAIYEFLN